MTTLYLMHTLSKLSYKIFFDIANFGHSETCTFGPSLPFDKEVVFDIDLFVINANAAV